MITNWLESHRHIDLVEKMLPSCKAQLCQLDSCQVSGLVVKGLISQAHGIDQALHFWRGLQRQKYTGLSLQIGYPQFQWILTIFPISGHTSEAPHGAMSKAHGSLNCQAPHRTSQCSWRRTGGRGSSWLVKIRGFVEHGVPCKRFTIQNSEG